MPKVTINRKAHFNAAHRLFNPKWSDKKNAEIFGKCSNPNYHGHNYEFIVSITGEIEEETGFVMDLSVMKKLIETEIEEAFDHKNLNIEVEEFKTLNPTVENISVVIYDKLYAKIPKNLNLKITLYETPRNYASYSGE